MEQSHTPIDYSAMARENWGLPADATDADVEAARTAHYSAMDRENWGLPADATDADVEAARTAHYSAQRHIGGAALQ